jgi:hypothetical protein
MTTVQCGGGVSRVLSRLYERLHIWSLKYYGDVGIDRVCHLYFREFSAMPEELIAPADRGPPSSERSASERYMKGCLHLIELK